MKRLFVVLALAAVFGVGCSEKAEVKKEKQTPRLKGTGYGDGPVATPLKAMYSAKRKIKVEFAVASTVRVYKAEHGHAPKDQQEFEKMLEKYDVTLPKPQEGFRYKWNAKDENVEFVLVEK
jgi:hypothetical protein